MKRFYIAALLVLFTVKVQSQTSLEEYNYLTKGYEIAINSGLDLKSGYFFMPAYEVEKGNYSFKFQEFVRYSDSTFAGTSVLATSSVSGKTYYLCIPFFDDELTGKYEDYIYASWDAAITRAYAYALSEYYIELAVYVTEIDVTPKLKEKFQEYIGHRYRNRISLEGQHE